MANEENKIIIEASDDDTAVLEPAQDNMRVFVFNLGKELYACKVREAREIIKVPDVAKVYNVPDFVLGVFNLRGSIVAVLDMGYFFGRLEPAELKNANVVIAEYNKMPVGFVVDGLKGSMDIDQALIQPPLATVSKKIMSYTIGQVESGGAIVVLIDLEKILNSEEISGLRKGGG